jgi:hypothetical protein
MSKKLFFGIIFFLLCLNLFAQSGMKIVLEERNGELTIIRAQGKTKELIIPPAVRDMPITAIGEGAFAYNELTTLVIGNNVETIGRKAFSNNRISDLTIGENVTTIGMGAFADNHLAALTIPASVVTVEPYAFFNNRLRNVTIPDNVTAIGEGAFSSNRIFNVVIGGGVEEIGDGAFFNNQLTNITIPGSLVLGKRVFESRLTKKTSVPPVDYVDEVTGDVLYTTASNFDTYFASTGERPGKYSFNSRDGWVLEE